MIDVLKNEIKTKSHEYPDGINDSAQKIDRNGLGTCSRNQYKCVGGEQSIREGKYGH